jgi:hypothetical protein
MEVNVHLHASDGDPLSIPMRYRHLVGSFVYLAITRSDISYRVHILSQFAPPLILVHYSHLRVLRYLGGTISRRLFFPCFSSLDATWDCDLLDRCAYCVFLGDSLITWKTKKQSCKLWLD